MIKQSYLVSASLAFFIGPITGLALGEDIAGQHGTTILVRQAPVEPT